MEIANPIYDVVFKYLMEDNRVAKLFLSAVTGLEIVALEFLPQELSTEGKEVGKKPRKKDIISALDLSIYRLDFSARVRETDGAETVIIIEIQKSKFANEGMRFRKYLGKQYMNPDFFRWIMEASGRSVKTGIPILPIYFLGKPLAGFSDVPVILVNRCVRDRHTQQVLDVGHHFIESLFHEGIIVHIPAIDSDRRRDELEMLLSIFDQDNRQENHHIMNVQEVDFPEKFRPIIRRLQAAAQEKEIRDTMTIEDDFVAELNDYEHRIAAANQEKEEAIRQQAVERSLKEEALRKQEEALRKQEEERKKKEEARTQQRKAIALLLSLGISKSEIAHRLELPLEDLEGFDV